MPYVHCPLCGLRTFTAAHWLNPDHCGACGTELPRAVRRFERRAPLATARAQPSPPPPFADQRRHERAR